MQERQGFQNRWDGRMEEHERRVEQMIGAEARDALRGQKKPFDKTLNTGTHKWEPSCELGSS